MKLRRLTLENFRQHACTAVEFRDGMTAIVGSNGSGKSTILEAITFALYGEQRNTKDSLCFFWSEKRKFKVRLEFEFDGRSFAVDRSQADALLSEITGESKAWASGLKDTTAACEKLLGLTYDQFVNSFCAEQKSLAFLNFKTNAARQDEVARMLGYDRLKSAESLAGEHRKECSTRANTLERTMGDAGQLEADRKKAQEGLSEAQKKLRTLASSKEELEKAKPAALEASQKATQWIEHTQEMDAIRGKAEGLKQALAIAEDALKQAESDLAEMRSLTPSHEAYRSAEGRLKELANLREQDRLRETKLRDRDRLLEEIQGLRAKVVQLAVPDMAALREAASQAEASHLRAGSEREAANQVWQGEITRLKGELAVARATADAAVQALGKAQEMLSQGKCPVCEQPLGKAYDSILKEKEMAAEAAAASVIAIERDLTAAHEKPGRVLQAETALQGAERSVQQAQAALSSARDLESQAKTLGSEIEKRERDARRLTEELEATRPVFDPAEQTKVETALVELRDKHERFLALQHSERKFEGATTQFQDAKRGYDSAKARYTETELKRQSLPFVDSASANAALGHFRKLEEDLRTVGVELRTANDLHAIHEKMLEDAARALNVHRQNEADRTRLKKAETLFETTAKEMRTLRADLNAAIGPELAAKASENLSLLTNGRYSRLMLDGNFNAAVLEDDSVSKSVISGGEEDVVALSLRLALSELIQERQGRPMTLLVLDEVFGSLDAERRQGVLDRLAALKGRFEQILVISHIEEINQVADQCLYLTRDPISRSTCCSDVPPCGFDL